MKYRLLGLFCALFVLLDLAATFVQYNRMVLDGDLVAIVHPSVSYAPVLHDPFGLAVLTKDSVYAAPNRFFAHLSMVGYWRAVPGWLQRAGLAPIDSVYAAQALFCTLLQALLLYVLAVYIVGAGGLGNWRLWLAMALLAPFFQAQGYSSEMAIVPRAVTYAFFYPLPLLLLLVVARPFYRWAQGAQWHLGPLGVVGCLGLMVWLAFNGPLVPGVVAVLLLGGGMHWARSAGPPAGWASRLRQLPWVPLVLLLLFGLLCAYSLYIGRNNSESLLPKHNVFGRYLRLPYGVFRQLTGKLGVPLLVLACLGNGYLLRRQVPATAESQRIRQVLRVLGWFALVYILLLPLGGYRTYRAYSLRFDTILPITLGLLFFYGLSALYLLRHLAGRARASYAVGLVVIACIYANADRKLRVADGNDCERAALLALGQAPAELPAVHLAQDCNVLSWDPITNPANSTDQAAMLQYWNITWGPRPYYH
ncbi:hypothetical protein HHL22_14855 [Hymenobacter sp. RP-2-7]|uniref:Glycosyltransferase RgtA/B/C/D-like domain-containing protein n=1 Tax=Hymenobacter polaris TaxID=2682546 RepID=A0A7Y0AFQ6_9BACT|nr:hypothetical protein [Hymenobacter polaris]NML66486.1 hypothetical protein [Hymenobacter polaris]